LISGLGGSKGALYRGYCRFSRDNRLDTISPQVAFQMRVWVWSLGHDWILLEGREIGMMVV